MINKFINLTKADLDSTVWRYLTFSKFISLITYQALWFPKLNILRDKYEGTLPPLTKSKMHEENQKWKDVFTDPDHQLQIDEMPDRNVQDGRELIVVNCWFLGDTDSKRMWDDYVGSSEGIAIKSTIRKLSRYVYGYPEFSYIGKVKYVELYRHDMNSYEAHQAHERAFLKDNKYGHEQEIRIDSMSIKTPMCVNVNGKPLTEQEYTGKNMNNFEKAGLYIKVDLNNLIDAIVLAPKATEWFELLIRRIFELMHINGLVERSHKEKCLTNRCRGNNSPA